MRFIASRLALFMCFRKSGFSAAIGEWAWRPRNLPGIEPDKLGHFLVVRGLHAGWRESPHGAILPLTTACLRFRDSTREKANIL